MTRDEIINNGIRYLAREFVADRDEFRRDVPGGDMLLTALTSGGYARDRGGNVQLTDMGRRRLADVDRAAA